MHYSGSWFHSKLAQSKFVYRYYLMPFMLIFLQIIRRYHEIINILVKLPVLVTIRVRESAICSQHGTASIAREMSTAWLLLSKQCEPHWVKHDYIKEVYCSDMYFVSHCPWIEEFRRDLILIWQVVPTTIWSFFSHEHVKYELSYFKNCW